MDRFRIQLRLAAVLAGLLLALTAVPVSAEGQPHQYLALGDSVAFGYSPLLDKRDASNFVGYPEVLTNKLTPHRQLANASCPGEASGGFISFDGVDNSCRPYRSAYPLHIAYSTPQVEYAVAYLRSHRHTDLVTINIGANDLFALQTRCHQDLACVIAGLPAMLDELAANLSTIYQAIRQLRYQGNLVALTYYVSDYTDPLALFVIGAINDVVAGVTRRFGGDVADGFGAFKNAAEPFGGKSCDAGLLIRLAGGTCDIHPSPAGRDLLAGAIFAIVGGDGRQD